MDTKKTYCSHCQKLVEVGLSPAPAHRRVTDLPPEQELVCLDFGTGCSGNLCPLSGLPSLVMGVRMQRAPDAPDPEKHRVLTACHECGVEMEMPVLDESHARCPSCGVTNKLILIRLDDDSFVAVSQGSWE